MNYGAESAVSVRTLNEARTLLAAGRVSEAVPLFLALIDTNPLHLEARNALAIVALRAGDLAAARGQLEAALSAAPDDVLTLNHWAQLQQGEGDMQAAAQTYRRLLAQQPSLFAVRLAYSKLLEASGDGDAALLHYFRAIRNAQRAGRWLSDESTPTGLRADVRRAMEMVAVRRRSLCDDLMNSLVDRFGRSSLDRVADCIAMQMGDAIYVPEDTRQKPLRFPFPGLPQVPYLDKRRISGIAELEAQAAAILAELQGILGGSAGRENVFRDPVQADQSLRGARGPAVWDGYYFYRYGQRNETNASACPRTIAAVDKLPLCRVRGYGPEVLFSTLGPGTHLLPHHGVTNARIVGHLPLIVPPGCALRVAGAEHVWQVGDVVMFDDTYSHEAWNRSAETRVVMIFDLWHPDLSEAERVAVRELFEVLGDLGADADRVEV
jgi:aspartate beta-hydroxylase